MTGENFLYYTFLFLFSACLEKKTKKLSKIKKMIIGESHFTFFTIENVL